MKKLYLVGTTPTPLDRFGRKRADLAKVALGAEEMLDWEYAEGIRGVIDDLREQEFKITALEQHKHAIHLTPQPPLLKLGEGAKGERSVLIVGNETEGVSPEVLVMADEVLEIPMLGNKESLNVSVATGIALYELLK